MIPLRDTIRSRTTPILTWALIVANVLVFLWELSLGPGLESQLVHYAFVPARFFPGHSSYPFPAGGRYLSLLTSMFLHGGWLHLLGNMLFLFIFGDNVEDAFGHVPYAGFYLAGGVASALVQGLASPSSAVPMVGASGAIAAVLGAYFVLYPHGRVLTLVPLLFFFPVIEIPAFAFLLFWFALQFLSGIVAPVGPGLDPGVAWWAHVGGFAFGLAAGLLGRIAKAAAGRPM